MDWWLMIALLVVGFQLGQLVEWWKQKNLERIEFDRRMDAYREQWKREDKP